MKKKSVKKNHLKIVKALGITAVIFIAIVVTYDILSYKYYERMLLSNKLWYMEVESYRRYLKKQLVYYQNIINISDYIKRNNFFHHEVNSYDLALIIVKEAMSKELDPYLILAIIDVESNFKYKSESAMGAKGLMQLRTPTAVFISQKNDIDISSSKLKNDPLLNVKLGIAYFHYLLEKFDGNYKYALIAYNMGVNKVYSLMSARINLPKSYYSRVIEKYREIVDIYKLQEVQYTLKNP